MVMFFAILALAGCGKDDDVATVTKDMKVCRDGGGKPALSTDPFGKGLHIICWPKEAFN
jgi:hypothetical protein